MSQRSRANPDPSSGMGGRRRWASSVVAIGLFGVTLDLPAAAADLQSTVRAAIAPTTVGLWLRAGGR
jgi:hypothetical protein